MHISPSVIKTLKISKFHPTSLSSFHLPRFFDNEKEYTKRD